MNLSNKRKGLTLFLLTCLVMNFSLQAQVTVGGLTNPAAGAILDLNRGTKGGLVLSNITITDSEKIPAGLTGLSGEQDTCLPLSGMMVYNLGSQEVPEGVYVWNGYHWSKDGRIAPPVINAVNPATSLRLITTDITITGADLESAYEVFIDFDGDGELDADETCTNITVNKNQITCTTPGGAAGLYNVIVNTRGGKAVYGDESNETGFIFYINVEAVVAEITASGDWTVPAGCQSIDVFLVGGGGGGANSGGGFTGGGSGGGGGYTETALNIPVVPNEQLSITVGSGGNGGGGAGTASSIKRANDVLAEAKGGNGGGYAAPGGDGGSGGGGASQASGGDYGAGGAGGSDGNNGYKSDHGDTGSTYYAGGLGQGTSTACPFNSKLYAGGGGGSGSGIWAPGTGGSGGGGAGGIYHNSYGRQPGANGTANTGGGGGGGVNGGAGGSGIVIIRYSGLIYN